MSDVILTSLVEASLRVSVVAAAVGVMLLTLRIRADSTRHIAWTVVLCGMLLMPFLPYCLPVLEIPVLPFSQRAGAVPVSPEPDRLALATGPNAVERPSPTVSRTPEQHPPPHPSEQSVESRPMWSVLALAIYVLGAVPFFVRFALGWRAAGQIARGSQPIVTAPDRRRLGGPDGCGQLSTPRLRLCESGLVVTPVTLGVIAPSIILPATWRQWPTDMLCAILSHECAHVRRRDPLVNILAHLNRCVFWFHPLAWWLTHKLATVAEHVCDDAAVRAVGDPRRYAEVLINMAALTSRNGGRMSRQSMGIDGEPLGERINRVVRGSARQETSAILKWGIAASCAVTIFLVVVCRRQPAPPAQLRESPKATRQEPIGPDYVAARDLNASAIAALESSYQKSPEDLETLTKLLVFYWAHVSPEGARGDEKLTTRRRARILWLITHHPDSDLAGSPIARLFSIGLGSLSDPVGYARARQLWLAHTESPDASVTVLANAAKFFAAAEKPRAEALLVRASAEDPQGPWSERLGQFYASALTGRFFATRAGAGLRDIGGTEPQGLFADSVRRKLAESSDERLLVAAAEQLMRTPHSGRLVDHPARLLALPVLQRAVAVSPGSVRAHADLAHVLLLNRGRRVFEFVGDVPPIAELGAISALPEAERFEVLLEKNETPPQEFPPEWRADPNLIDRIQLGRTQDRKWAEDLLRLARLVHDDRVGTAIYFANMRLASIALSEGNRKAAVLYMLTASKAPGSEELAYSRHVAAWKLVRRLLEQGERKSVIEFLERMASTSIVDRASLHEWATTIRRGEMPNFEYYWTAYYPSHRD
jgi:hypothetical protein